MAKCTVCKNDPCTCWLDELDKVKQPEQPQTAVQNTDDDLPEWLKKLAEKQSGE